MRLLIHIAIGFTILAVFATHRVEAQNRSGRARELITAADKGDIEKVTKILDAGVNINATVNDRSEFSGRTALMVASLRGYERLVDLLLSRKANVDLQDRSGQTALLLGMDTGNLKIVKALLRAGANPNVKVVSPHAGEITPLVRAIISDSDQRLELIRTLLEANAEINPTGTFMMSPLMHAVSDLEIVKLLISHGANIHQTNFRGATPLMGAAGAGDIAVVRYLIERGADVNARDTDGHTALVYAEERREVFAPQRRDEIIQLLKTTQAQPKPR